MRILRKKTAIESMSDEELKCNLNDALNVLGVIAGNASCASMVIYSSMDEENREKMLDMIQQNVRQLDKMMYKMDKTQSTYSIMVALAYELIVCHAALLNGDQAYSELSKQIMDNEMENYPQLDTESYQSGPIKDDIAYH